MTKDNIAIKYTTDSLETVMSDISEGQPGACLPGEPVLSAQSSSARLAAVDANGTGARVMGVLSNGNKGSVTVSSLGEGPTSILLNANSVTESVLASNSVSSEKIATPLLITKGGTGQSTENAALNALLPSQTSNNNRLLTSNGTNTSWVGDTLGIDQLNDVNTSSATRFKDQVLKWDSSTLQWRQNESITTFTDQLLTNQAPGREGQVGTGEEYFYVCQGTNKWSRTALQTWSESIVRAPTTSNIAFTYEPIVARSELYFLNVSLLLHFNSSPFIDSSLNAHPITTGGLGVALNTSIKKFGAGSATINTGNVRAGGATSLDLIGSNFTVELWVYPLLYRTTETRIISAAGSASSSTGGLSGWTATDGIHWMMQLSNTGKLIFQYWSGTARSGWSTAATVPLNAWTHVAVSLSGSNVYLAVNGTVESFPVGTIARPSGVFDTWMGTSRGDGSFSSTTYSGYMDEVRITKGVARYTSNFIPSTIEFPELGYIRDTNFANVSLLLHADGSNGDTLIKDYSPNGLNVITTGIASISTAQSKFGGSSISLPSTTSFVTALATGSEFSFGSDKFTIEFFGYFTHAASQFSRWITFSGTTGGYGELTIRQESSNQYSFFYYIDGVLSGPHLGGTVTRNAWTHIALVRGGIAGQPNSWYLYANGIVVRNVILSSTLPSFSKVTLGGFSGEHGTGFYDEVRITKGVGRYSINFTPPTAPFPDAS